MMDDNQLRFSLSERIGEFGWGEENVLDDLTEPQQDLVLQFLLTLDAPIVEELLDYLRRQNND